MVLDLRPVLDRDVENLSGGELQRFAIAVACVQKADVYVEFPVTGSFDLIVSIGTCSTSRPPTWMSSSV